MPPAPPRPAPPQLPSLTLLQLRQSSFATLPPLTAGGQLLQLSISVPVRNDPVDPAWASYRQIVQILETLPQNFPFRTKIIGAVPNPIKKIGGLDSGFGWGLDPLFDLKKLAGPTEFTVGLRGNAHDMPRVINQPGPAGLKLGIFARGDFKSEFDFTSSKAQSRPLLTIQGSILTGIEGRF